MHKTNLKLRCLWHHKRLWIVDGNCNAPIVIHPDGTLCIPNRTSMGWDALVKVMRQVCAPPCPLVSDMQCQCGKPDEPSPLACTIWKVETDGKARARQV